MVVWKIISQLITDRCNMSEWEEREERKRRRRRRKKKATCSLTQWSKSSCHYVFLVHWTGTTGAHLKKCASMCPCIIACSVKVVATDFLFFSISHAAPAPRPQLFHRLHFRSKWPSRSKSLLRKGGTFHYSYWITRKSQKERERERHKVTETELKLHLQSRYYYSFLFLLPSPSCEPEAWSAPLTFGFEKFQFQFKVLFFSLFLKINVVSVGVLDTISWNILTHCCW